MTYNSINICLACDDNYSKYAGVVMASILANADSIDNLNFYILDGGISQTKKNEILTLKSIKECSINFISVDESQFEDYKKIKTHSYISLPAYYRLKLASLLPNIKRVIYFDCDIVVNSSLRTLFNAYLGNNPIAGVKDINKKMLKKNPTYVNSGMLVMDLENIRQLNIEQEFFEWTRANINNIKTGDQEIINEVCKNKITILDEEWNVQSSNFTNRSSYTKTPRIIHFVASKKPWHFASFSYHKPYYFKYLQLTPWALNEKELKYWTRDNQIASLLAYFKHRPLFMLRPRFYQALFYTYLENFTSKIFSIKDYGETHRLVRIFGLKIKFPKKEFADKRRENLYYYYKKNNIDITTIPPAEGQIRDIQLANLALLKELDYVCKQSGLKYWLDFGTLLGAVRHKGFIPWDDDIDVGMRREDYDKIKEAFKEFSRDKNIYADYFICTNAPCQAIIKIQHKKCSKLFVDIFPYDNYGKILTKEEQIETSEKFKKIRTEMKKLSSLNSSTDEVLQIIEQNRKNLLSENKENGNLVWGIDFEHHWKNWLSDYETIYPLKNINFENIEFPCINNIEKYLTEVYGDYMAYPQKIGFGHNMFTKLSNEELKIIRELKG